MGNFIIQNGIIVNEGRQFVGSLVVTNGIIAKIITEGTELMLENIVTMIYMMPRDAIFFLA